MTISKPSRRGLCRSALLASVSMLAAATSHAAADPDYEDWWLCANDCKPDDAACIDKCTDDYNESHQVDPGARAFKLKQARTRTPAPGARALVNKCPTDTHLAPFDLPIYDRNGVFVVGHKTIWVCLPDDLEPAG